MFNPSNDFSGSLYADVQGVTWRSKPCSKRVDLGEKPEDYAGVVALASYPPQGTINKLPADGS